MLPYAIGFEVVLWLAGLVLFGRIIFGSLRLNAPALPAWTVPIEDFATAILAVTAGAFLLPQAATHLSNDLLGRAAHDGDWWMMVQGYAFQLGLLGGVLASGLYLRLRFRPAPPAEDAPAVSARTRRPLLAGTVTFLIALPLIGGLGFGWKALLEKLGYPTGEQEMIDVFRNIDDPVLLILMVFLAAVVAPVTEELIFRAGLFRYLRTRIPHWIALTIPALIFAVLHGNLVAFLPLVALGILFSVAYEQTGRIAVPMIAHALFNLHTLLLVMAGVST